MKWKWKVALMGDVNRRKLKCYEKLFQESRVLLFTGEAFKTLEELTVLACFVFMFK